MLKYKFPSEPFSFEDKLCFITTAATVVPLWQLRISTQTQFCIAWHTSVQFKKSVAGVRVKNGVYSEI
jgi:hypothetical protein